MSKKIKLTTDSSCDYPKELLKKLGIDFMPIIVILKDKEYQDMINISPENIFDFVKQTNKLPKTAAISAETFKHFFKTQLEGGYDIIHIGLGEKLSATTSNARIAAKDFGGRVHVIDPKSLSTGTMLLLLYAHELINTGKFTASEIAEKIRNRIPHVQASFVVETIEYLYKGGRCSMLAALGANLLRLKPRLQLVDGKIISNGKYRGKMLPVYLKYIDDTLTMYNTPDTTRCFITHSFAEPELVEQVKKYVEEKKIFKEIIVTTAGSTITSHCGKGTLGLLYINDGEIK